MIRFLSTAYTPSTMPLSTAWASASRRRSVVVRSMRLRRMVSMVRARAPTSAAPPGGIEAEKSPAPRRVAAAVSARTGPATSSPRIRPANTATTPRISAGSEEHTSELQSRSDLVCRLLLEKKKAHVELQSRSDLVCRLLLEKNKRPADTHTADCTSSVLHCELRQQEPDYGRDDLHLHLDE